MFWIKEIRQPFCFYFSCGEATLYLKISPCVRLLFKIDGCIIVCVKIPHTNAWHLVYDLLFLWLVGQATICNMYNHYYWFRDYLLVIVTRYFFLLSFLTTEHLLYNTLCLFVSVF